MGDESKPGAAPAAAPRSGGRWRAAWVFSLVWVGCWLAKGQLLAWWLAPLQLGERHLTLSVSRPADAFFSYVELCSVVALAAVLPLVTRALTFRRQRPPVGFVQVSYALLAVAVLTSHFLLAPMIFNSMVVAIAPRQSLSLGLRELFRFLALLHLSEAAVAQLSVVLATRARGARDGSRGAQILRLVLLGFAAFVLAVFLTPRDAPSQWVVWLTFASLMGIASLVTRVLRAGEARPENEQPAEPTEPNPFKPPAAG